MKKTLTAILAVLIAVALFAFGFRVGRLHGSNPMRTEYYPIATYKGTNFDVELIQVRSKKPNTVACSADGHSFFPARADNVCYLADAQ